MKIKNKKRFFFSISIILLIIILLTCLIILCIRKNTKSVASSSLNTLNDNFLTFQNSENEFPNVSNIEELNSIENAEFINNISNIETQVTSNEFNQNTTKKSALPYYIKVNYGAQVVTIYTQDSNGNYTVPYKSMVCSTGVATPTSGVYSIPARWEWLGLQGDVYGHYCTQIKGNILFHSVPYLTKWDNSSLEYWEYDKLGTYASAGCIRLTVTDAQWIFNNCSKGTKVEFYSDSNPGPLGKPSSKKISAYPDYLRNWDPTDSNPNNPWHSYNEPSSSDNNLNNIIQNEDSSNLENNEISTDNSDNVLTPDENLENSIENIENAISNSIDSTNEEENLLPNSNNENNDTIANDNDITNISTIINNLVD